MTHQFTIGDTVRLNGTNRDAKVIGVKEPTGSEGSLLCVVLEGTTMYFPVKAVTLIAPHREVEPIHPSKIET